MGKWRLRRIISVEKQPSQDLMGVWDLGGCLRDRSEAIFHSPKNSSFWPWFCHALCDLGHISPLLGFDDHQPHNYRTGLGVSKCPSTSGLFMSPGTQHIRGLEPIPSGCPESSLLTKSAKSPTRHIYFCPAGIITTWAREPASAELERLKSWL